MKTNYCLLLLFVIISQIGMAQHIERKVLKGRIVADSIEVENLTVFNITSNIGAVTNADGKFSIDALRCVGACGLAPVVLVGEKVYGRVTPEEVKKIVEEYND